MKINDQSISLLRNKKKWTEMINQLFCWEMTKNDQVIYLPRNEKMTGQLLYLVFFFFQCIVQMISLIHLYIFYKFTCYFYCIFYKRFLQIPQWSHPNFYHSLSSSSTSFVFNFENHSWMNLYYKFQCLIASLWLHLSHFIIKCKQCQMCILYSTKISSQIM